MQKSVLLAAIQREIQLHDFNHFVANPPIIAEGGKGVVVSGRPTSRKPSQFDEAVPGPSGV